MLVSFMPATTRPDKAMPQHAVPRTYRKFFSTNDPPPIPIDGSDPDSVNSSPRYNLRSGNSVAV